MLQVGIHRGNTDRAGRRARVDGLVLVGRALAVVVPGCGHDDRALAPRVLDRVGERGVGTRPAEAEVDHPRAVVGGPHDALGHVRAPPAALVGGREDPHGQDPDVGRGTGDALPVVRHGRDRPGDVGAVPAVVDHGERSWSIAPRNSWPGRTLPARSGWPAATPVSTIATVIPPPSVVFHALRNEVLAGLSAHW